MNPEVRIAILLITSGSNPSGGRVSGPSGASLQTFQRLPAITASVGQFAFTILHSLIPRQLEWKGSL